MRLLLILATLADIVMALALLLVSPFVIKGVNNSGPQMPDALYFFLILLAAIAAPVVAWIWLERRHPGQAVLLAAAPPLLSVAVIFFDSFLIALT